MNQDIPKMMKAVVLEKESGRLITQNVPVPSPGAGEVLIKIAAAPVNPSDLARIKGMIGNEEMNTFIPGIEGSGTVVNAGKGLLPKLWMGKRVSCSSTLATSGTWAEYMVTKAGHCFPISKDISHEQGSMLLVNPMTAAAFMDMVKKGKHKAIINTSAAGALGKMIICLAGKNNIPIINIVRNDKQVHILKAEGAKYILNSADVNFADQLHSLAKELHATLAFDSIGGEQTKVLLGAIPYGGNVIVYGNLSGETPVVDHKALVIEDKKVSGFYLANWINDNGFIKTFQNLNMVKQLLKTNIKITIQGTYPLEKAQQAIDDYLNNMTDGKILLIP